MKQCDNGHFYDDARFTECPYCRDSASVSKTVAVAQEPVGKTVPVSGAAAPCQDGKTVGILKSRLGIEPPVGFLVCIKGAAKGKEFRLISGRCFIGRSSSMDISLADDTMVSRENHAIVSYDSQHNTFLLAPGVSRGITYLNGEQVETATKLSAYDKIEVGGSVLLFLPLCGEQFSWTED